MSSPNIKPNLSAIGSIVREMTPSISSRPDFNAAAANIIKQGIAAKEQARVGYQPKLTPKQML